MSAELAAVLKSAQGDAVPLVGVSAKGRLTGLLFELRVEQIYENTAKTNIEAEYTFPVPHRAVLLGLDLQVGERELQAVAVRRAVARENYEEAIDKGDTAALLERSGDGLYSLSLGNLMAGERAVIRYRYAELLDRSGDEVRLAIPTVIAPRYGEPAAHGIVPHQVPGVDLLVQYPFSLEVDVMGEMAGATLHSPSHEFEISDIEGGRRVTLAPGAFLDRDFILGVTGIETRSASLVTCDGEGYVALLSLDPRIAGPAASPLALKLVADCSGSMGGDSIACARRALLAILDRLDARDRVSITRFGSTIEHLAVPQAPAAGWRNILGNRAGRARRAERRGELTAVTPAAIEWLRHAVRAMDADLGGTELGAALQAAVAIPAGDAAVKDILLITDAEVWAVESVLDAAARSGHRLFVVAVGAAPAEALARQLAEKTGGACEFVSPNEDAEAAIVRMFRRLREAPKRVVRVEWPAAPAWQAPLPVAVFSGDTVHLLAGFAAPPAGAVGVTIAGVAEGDIRLSADLAQTCPHDVLPRLAAAKRLASLGEEEAAQLAEKYQLASAHTSFVVVQVRDAEGKAAKLPDLRAVPHMLAAGWGATGEPAQSNLFRSPVQTRRMNLEPLACRSPMASNRFPAMYRRVDARDAERGTLEWSLDPDLAAALDALSPAEGAAAVSPQIVVEALRDVVSGGLPLPEDVDGLAQLGVPADVLAVLRAVIDSYDSLPDAEARVVRVWIALLAKSPAGDGLTDTERAALKGTVPGGRENRTIRAVLGRCFADVSAAAWTAQVPAPETVP